MNLRLDLFQKLKKLPAPMFEEILFGLNPPAGIIHTAQAPQSDRVKALLDWATSIGPGLAAVETVYTQIVPPR